MIKIGTLLQEIYNSFFLKIPDEDFSWKQDMVFQLLKNAHAKSYKTVPENLSDKIENNILLKNDGIIIVRSQPEQSGNIKITINDIDYIIFVSELNSIKDIVESIYLTIKNDYQVEKDYSNKYPMLIVTDNNIKVDIKYLDTEDTGIGIIITKTYNGEYNLELGQDSVELISMFMAQQFYERLAFSLGKAKQHVGTQAFNKFPNLKDKLESVKSTLEYLNDSIYEFKQEFYSYKN